MSDIVERLQNVDVVDYPNTTEDMCEEAAIFIRQQAATIAELREALEMAAKQFRFYEDNHLAKETRDGIKKAVTNRKCAEQCEKALARTASK